MVLTEEKAREKLCGQLRDFTTTQGLKLGEALAEGKISSEEEFIECAKNVREMSLCISKECMNWQWRRDTGENGGADKGYCGLAGKPE